MRRRRENATRGKRERRSETETCTTIHSCSGFLLFKQDSYTIKACIASINRINLKSTGTQVIGQALSTSHLPHLQAQRKPVSEESSNYGEPYAFLFFFKANHLTIQDQIYIRLKKSFFFSFFFCWSSI